MYLLSLHVELQEEAFLQAEMWNIEKAPGLLHM